MFRHDGEGGGAREGGQLFEGRARGGGVGGSPLDYPGSGGACTAEMQQCMLENFVEVGGWQLEIRTKVTCFFVELQNTILA